MARCAGGEGEASQQRTGGHAGVDSRRPSCKQKTKGRQHSWLVPSCVLDHACMPVAAK